MSALGRRYVRPTIRSWLAGGWKSDPSYHTHSLKGAIMRKLLTSALLIASLAGCAGPATLPAPSPVSESIAWEIFDHGGGSSKLRLDPTRPFRVDFRGASYEYPPASPDDAVVPGKDGRWYWFALSYTD